MRTYTPNGYTHARYFDLVIFNTETLERRTFTRCDALDLLRGENPVPIREMGIYADGSTMILFCSMAQILFDGQRVYVKGIE